MKFIGVIIVFLLSWGVVAGQSRAERLFERGDYLGALKLYQKEVENAESGTNTDQIKSRIANCFFHLNDVVRAGQMYKSLNQDILNGEDLLFYSITLLRSGEYDKAAELADMAESVGCDQLVVERVRASCEFAKEVMKEKPVYAANKTNVNFAGFSSGVTYYKGKGIILAAPGVGEDAMKDTRGYKSVRLYNAIFSADGKGGRMLPFAEELVDKYHIGAVTFTKDYNRIYYTKTILKKDGTSILKLMTAENNNGKWENNKELNINSDDYSCAHPCLFRDSLLFFVSDMPGGIGGKDIYMTLVQGDECGEIQNLGDVVNTPDDEVFPFIDESGKLYFSSNGHIGLGGLDVFISEMNADGTWTEPQNMGRPINSSMDDFGLVFKDTKCAEGYISSNRGGTGYNDFLFSLKLLPNRKALPVKEEKVVVPEKEMFTVDYRYAIQVGAFRNPVPRVYFEHFQNVKVYLGYDNIYRYTVGEYPDEDVARRDLTGARQFVEDAFVMNVDRYVAEKKIQHDIKGDKISDDELLLIRLKKFETQKKLELARKERQSRNALPSRRYIDKPKESEFRWSESGYTVVLMPTNQVLDMSVFDGIDEVDVYSMSDGSYMYCSGMYADRGQAERCLRDMKSRGFRNAYVLGRGDENNTSSASSSIGRREADVLRNLLRAN
ncbi:MAG: hypothetical protein NC410_03230 [Oscillibacter sp.]|nr:hypothetical protein [Oscillibacter sp.]